MTVATRPLEPREVAGLLRSMRAAIAAELTEAPDDVLSWHPAPGEWCAKECLGHLLEAERRGFNGRIRTILAEHEPRLAGWDQQAVAREGKACPPAPADPLVEFQAAPGGGVDHVEGAQA